jgi:hypothetical protein
MAVAQRASFTARGSMSDVTRILSQIEEGGPKAAEELLPLVHLVRVNSRIRTGITLLQPPKPWSGS